MATIGLFAFRYGRSFCFNTNNGKHFKTKGGSGLIPPVSPENVFFTLTYK